MSISKPWRDSIIVLALVLLYAVSLKTLVTSTKAQLGASGYTNIDSALFLSMGRLWTKGFVPYRDIWDHKPPMVFFLTGAGYLLTPKSSLGSGFLFMALVGVGVLAWVGIFYHFRVRISGAFGITVLLYGFLMTTNRQWYLMTETIAFTFSSVALFLALKRSYWLCAFLSGVSIALAGLSKQSIVADGLAVAVLLLWQRDGFRLRPILFAALGGMMVLSAVIVILSLLGALKDAWQCFLFNFRFGYPRLFRIYHHSTFYVPLAFFLAGMFGAVFRFRRGLIPLGLVCWFAGATMIAGKGNAHYMVLLWTPTLFALAVGLPRILGEAISWPPEMEQKAVALLRRKAVLVAFFGLVTCCAVLVVFKGLDWEHRHSVVGPMIQKLNVRFRENQSAFVFSAGASSFWMTLNMRPATRWIQLVLLADRRYYPMLIQEIMSGLEKQPPDCILIQLKTQPYYESSTGYQALKRRLYQYVENHRYFRQESLSFPNFEVFTKEETPVSGQD